MKFAYQNTCMICWSFLLEGAGLLLVPASYFAQWIGKKSDLL